MGPGYIKDIKNWPRPKNKKEVERFLGFTNYHRAFIEQTPQHQVDDSYKWLVSYITQKPF
jgi:hypothetical protein